MTILRALRAVVLLSIPISTLACPLCHGAAAEQLRAELFGSHFGETVLLALAPFPVFGLIVSFVYYHFPVADSGRAARKRV